ncbi:DeoR/GlpR transcriptional regulator [Ornithinibacillus massiliensis]|uniref:DeoR/GlpR transcriptional regulator n=1 Tax=Ornithinibacillus massiliensis TaxID=1944633 RepID=A0ABS5MID6_9BACI|nr:DeoR/GlpR family DNA-binding transcription regulator [Ornithinibacillus massiliensis]MBS3682099.1 DeoR/GlpR transcriptional regulator [Ornithinibacillus massiliensis]
MLAEERRQIILEILQKDGRVIAKELADLFQISVDSVRRDLSMMENQGLLQKTYGGAIALKALQKVRTLPTSESKRYGIPEPHQDAISKLASSYIQEHDTVFIGGAGIQYGMLKHLPVDIPFTLVTNSMKIAESVRKQKNITAYLIGGKLRGESAGSIIDILAIEMMSKFSLDIGFITGGGITASGISTATPEGAAFARKVAEVSRKNICLAPNEKVGQNMFVTSVPIDKIDLIITDEAVSEKVIQDIEKTNAEIIIVNTTSTKE